MNQTRDERHAKIQSQHLERTAYVYVRQSSPRQVIEHLESQRRQYDLVSWASAAGWPGEQIVVIDEDQGKRGSSAKTRSGFARLIAAVTQGKVGIVIALEVTRLARNSPDWHHLLYLCRCNFSITPCIASNRTGLPRRKGLYSAPWKQYSRCKAGRLRHMISPPYEIL